MKSSQLNGFFGLSLLFVRGITNFFIFLKGNGTDCREIVTEGEKVSVMIVD